jgi:hypothetical protein
MIKQYEGNGVYNLHLTSGRELCLTENEINEITEDFIEEELKDLENENKSMLNSIEEQGQYIREIEDEIIPKLDECVDFIRKESNKQTYRSLITQLEDVMSELDCLGKYI